MRAAIYIRVSTNLQEKSIHYELKQPNFTDM